MSRISDLGKNQERLPEVLAEYTQELEEAITHLKIKGKTLEVANRENPSWQLYYSLKCKELETIVQYLEGQVQRVRGKLFKSYTSAHAQDLSDRAKEKYIDNEEAYLAMREIYLEAREIHEKYKSIVDSFQTRGYALNNITKARIADVHNYILE